MNKTILITGAGGAAAVSIIKALRGSAYHILAADMDPLAAGLYLVPEEDRILIPHAGSSEFVQALLETCVLRHVDVLIPTVDAELIPIADSVENFRLLGTACLSASAAVLRVVLDKFRLAQALNGVIPVPRTELVTDRFDGTAWEGPAVLKPRQGAGSRGISFLDEVPRPLETGPGMMIQEFLPGQEYSVDVLADRNGRALAAVPRERMKVDSGVAVAARTVRDPELEAIARRAVEHLGLPFISNVQLRRNARGVPHLLEINPRTPGTMPLTVASGINMPALSLKALFGRVDEAEIPTFREIATVRFWTERFIAPAELSALTRSARSAA